MMGTYILSMSSILWDRKGNENEKKINKVHNKLKFILLTNRSLIDCS